MTTTAIPMPTGLAGRPDASDHRPLCAGGCGRRTPGLLVDTCPDARCVTIASAAEWRRDRWDDQ